MICGVPGALTQLNVIKIMSIIKARRNYAPEEVENSSGIFKNCAFV